MNGVVINSIYIVCLSIALLIMVEIPFQVKYCFHCERLVKSKRSLLDFLLRKDGICTECDRKL